MMPARTARAHRMKPKWRFGFPRHDDCRTGGCVAICADHRRGAFSHSMRALILLLAVCGCARATTRPMPATDSFDVIITGGKIVDGTGNPWFYGDVGIRGDRLARIVPAGLLREARAERRIDARGLVVAPGVIDIQAQSYDQLLFGDSRVVSMITQGVTTMVLGEGDTPAPTNQGMLGEARRHAVSDTDMVRLRYRSGFTGERGFDAWLRAMERHGTSVNVGSFLGTGTVREYA